MVYCIGLTGDIASGKSTVAMIFSQLNIDVIQSDKISRELTQQDQFVYKQIIEHYGTIILNPDKELNRKQLRQIIFSNPKEREWLEHLMHPLIRQEIKNRVSVSTSPYCVVEIPLLITKQNYPYIDRVLLIVAPYHTQLSRIMERDECSIEEAQAILSAQPNPSIRLKNANDVVINDANIANLTTKINDLHKNYLKLSKI